MNSFTKHTNCYSVIFQFLLFFLLLYFPLNTSAQPAAETSRFPKLGPTIEKKAQDTIGNLNNKSGDLGQKAATNYSTDGKYWDEGKGSYKDHPWKNGRNPLESNLDWLMDSGKAVFNPTKLAKCMEPRIVSPVCPFCGPAKINVHSCNPEPNHGYVVAFWWPETEIEVNQFGISAFNPLSGPTLNLREKLLFHDLLAYQLKILWEMLPIDSPVQKKLQQLGIPDIERNFPSGLRDLSNLGQSATDGLSAADRTIFSEAHVYDSFVNFAGKRQRDPYAGQWGEAYKQILWFCIPFPYWYNGYQQGTGRDCFFNALDEPTPVVNMWTEETQFASYWRFPEMSAALSERSGNKFYQKIAPAGFADTSYMQSKSCASYRAARWPDRYGDLVTAVGIIANQWSDGERLCYPGGGDLYPITGTISGAFPPIVSAGFLSRRAVYLSSLMGPNRTHKFSDKVDKLQRISPDISECFKMDQLDELNTKLFPQGAFKPDPEQSIRYLYWNLRVACFCQYRGFYPIPVGGTDGLIGGFIPFGSGCSPFDGGRLPSKLTGKPETAKGDMDNQALEDVFIVKQVSKLPAAVTLVSPAVEAIARALPFISPKLIQGLKNEYQSFDSEEFSKQAEEYFNTQLPPSLQQNNNSPTNSSGGNNSGSNTSNNQGIPNIGNLGNFGSSGSLTGSGSGGSSIGGIGE